MFIRKEILYTFFIYYSKYLHCRTNCLAGFNYFFQLIVIGISFLGNIVINKQSYAKCKKYKQPADPIYSNLNRNSENSCVDLAIKPYLDDLGSLLQLFIVIRDVADSPHWTSQQFTYSILILAMESELIGVLPTSIHFFKNVIGAQHGALCRNFLNDSTK